MREAKKGQKWRQLSLEAVMEPSVEGLVRELQGFMEKVLERVSLL